MMITSRICFCLLQFLSFPTTGNQFLLTGKQRLDFSNKEFGLQINTSYWKNHNREGIVFAKNQNKKEIVIFLFPTSFSGSKFYANVDFADAYFDSSANFMSAALYSKSDFSHVTFRSVVDFWDATFDSGVSFQGAIFDSSVRFLYAGFRGSSNFFLTTFNSTSDFNGATFDSGYSFIQTTFKKEVTFVQTNFHSSADFLWITCNSAAIFQGSNFSSNANFGGSTFYSLADFKRDTFQTKANFSEVNFNSIVDFRDAKFGNLVSFQSSSFVDKALFAGATLPDSLDFRRITDIAKEIDFTFSLLPKSGGRCRIALYGSDMNKIKLNMELFELWFPQKDNIGIDQKSGIYESVMKKLKEDGLMESYQILDIEYRKFKSRNDGGLDWYIGDTFQDMWWNYGYSKQRILLWSIGLWMLFSLINLSLYSRLSEEVYGISFLESLRNVNISGSKKIAVHVLQVIVYTAIIFFGLKMDIEKFKPASVRTHIFLFIYLLVIFVSGLICLLCIVNYIFKG